MSDANVSANFSPEDWALVRSAPLMAGLLVTLSDLRTGPIGIVKEGFAPSQAIIEAGEGAANPIVASIVASIKESAKKGERLKPPFEVSGKTPEQLKADVAATLKRIPTVLEVKSLQNKPPNSSAGSSRLPTKSPMRARRADFLALEAKGSARRSQPPSRNSLPLWVSRLRSQLLTGNGLICLFGKTEAYG